MVVDQVVANHLCCGCGACVAACPINMLEMQETPAGYLVASESEQSCTQCGACLRVCPGRGLEDEYLAEVEDPFRGPILQAYWGHATNSKITRAGASGGVVTALLLGLLQEGSISAALVTRWDPQHPTRPQPYLAHTPDDLLSAQRSKYCQVPLNEIFRDSGPLEGPIAVVGTACQLHGLQKLSQLNRKLPDIRLRIGLFCDRVLSYHAISNLVRQSHVPEGDVEAFEYRHKGLRGWPGDVYVKPRGEKPRYVDRSARTRLKESLTPMRCRLCFDKFNVLADLACGDGYGGPVSPEGLSAILVRTPNGQEALQTVAEHLKLTAADPTAILRHHEPERRERSVIACSTAYEALYSPVSSPLPAACRRFSHEVCLKDSAQCQRVLRADSHFEQTTEAAAQRVIRQRLRSGRLSRIGRRLRGALSRLIRVGQKMGRRSTPDS